jgi:hypothetical protein
MHHIFDIRNKAIRLFIILSAVFLGNALVAEFMGVKIFSLEETLGLSHFQFYFFGEKIDGINLTCGVILWPVVFIMTDIINEYYGRRGVRFLSLLGAGVIGYAYVMLLLAMKASPAQWWLASSNYGDKLNFEQAYEAVFGQSNSIIVGSLLAFILGQIIDVTVFHWIKEKTGERYIWLRSTGSTLVSQLIDSFVVLFYAFYIARIGKDNQWSLQLVLAVCTVNYLYKSFMAVVLTPAIYIIHAAIEKYLGPQLATHLRNEAIVS